METFAGFAEHTDHEVGRLVQALEDMGAMDNTLLIYIVGDNGASAEGGPEGAYNEMMALNGIISTAAINMPHINEWGDPSTFPHYAIGWAWAGDTPFQWTKQIASHFGGTRNGMVMHWPKRIKAKGEIRSQFSHVTDIAPTALEEATSTRKTRLWSVGRKLGAIILAGLVIGFSVILVLQYFAQSRAIAFFSVSPTWSFPGNARNVRPARLMSASQPAWRAQPSSMLRSIPALL